MRRQIVIAGLHQVLTERHQAAPPVLAISTLLANAVWKPPPLRVAGTSNPRGPYSRPDLVMSEATMAATEAAVTATKAAEAG
jgi:hypothetical protein